MRQHSRTRLHFVIDELDEVVSSVLNLLPCITNENLASLGGADAVTQEFSASMLAAENCDEVLINHYRPSTCSIRRILAPSLSCGSCSWLSRSPSRFLWSDFLRLVGIWFGFLKKEN